MTYSGLHTCNPVESNQDDGHWRARRTLPQACMRVTHAHTHTNTHARTHARTHSRTHARTHTHSYTRPPGDPGDRRGLLHGAQAQARLPHRPNAANFHTAPTRRSHGHNRGRCLPRNAIGRGRTLKSRAEASLRREYFTSTL